MNRDLKVFLDKDVEMNGAEIEKVIRSGRVRFMIHVKPQHHQEGSGRKGEEAETTEKNNWVEEVPLEEIQTERMMWLAERVTSIENENEGMKGIIQETETKILLKENAMKETVERHLKEEAAIAYIVDHIQR